MMFLIVGRRVGIFNGYPYEIVPSWPLCFGWKNDELMRK